MTKNQENGTSMSGTVVVHNMARIELIDGIVVVTYLDGAEISVQIKTEIQACFAEIAGGKKYPFLFQSEGALWYDSAARAYARATEAEQPFVAVAFYAPGLGFKLLADFYGRVFKPAIPYKVFRKKDEAIAWLKSF